MSRPIPIAIISVLAILIGLVTLPVKILALMSPDMRADLTRFLETPFSGQILAIPAEVQFAHGIIGSIVWITAGIAMLRGRNWGRWLALFWAGSVLSMTVLLLGFKMSFLLKLPAFGAMVYFLTNRKSSAYFGGVKIEPSC